MYSKNATHFWSPPFDAINSDQERELKLNEFNITHLTLPRGQSGVAEARGKFANWTHNCILSQLGKDALILVSQTFKYMGSTLTRNGIISLVKVFPDDGSVKPHENTFEGPRKGRVEVMSGLGLIPEPIFMVVPGNSLGNIVTKTISKLKPDIEFDEPEGVHNRIFILADLTKISDIRNLLSDEIAIVADGHHRLAAVKELASERNGQWSYILSYIASAEDPALLISGIHRLVRKRVDMPTLLERAGEVFEIREITDKQSDVITLFDGVKYYSIQPRKELFEKVEIGVPTDLAMIVRKGLFEFSAGFSETDIERNVEYTHDPNYAINEVIARKASVALIMPDWKKSEFISSVASGHLLSQKATFFYPKIPSGIAIYKP